jgi:indolepyruvate ferredoxin oxidoreductase alpha subunit
VKRALDWAFDLEEPSVIITRWPCALKKLSENDREEFGAAFSDKCMVDIEKCIGCKMCTNTGCPAISLDKQNKKATINQDSCVGCGVCLQVCPAKAIGKVEA